MRPPRHVAYGTAVTINGDLSPLPPAGLSPGEGRRDGGEKGRGSAIRRVDGSATAARTPPALGSPAPSGCACGCTPRPGTAPSAAGRRRSRGTPTGPPPPP